MHSAQMQGLLCYASATSLKSSSIQSLICHAGVGKLMCSFSLAGVSTEEAEPLLAELPAK